MKILHASLPDFLLDESRSGAHYINLDEYRTNLLYLFLERPCPTQNPHSTSPNGKHESDLELAEVLRLFAIADFLDQAKASDRLQRACMNFNCIIYSARMVNDCSIDIETILNCLKKLVCLNMVYMCNQLIDTTYPIIGSRRSRSSVPSCLGRVCGRACKALVPT
jgi:hypothetical protein